MNIARRKCPLCGGSGLSGKRDEWGIGIPCSKCKGTGRV